jgi:hypothetical protein
MSVIPDNAPRDLVAKVSPGCFQSVIGFDEDGAPVVASSYPADHGTPSQLRVYDPETGEPGPTN